MSLKVWLPLNGSLENKGCGNYPLTMHRGNLVYHDGGKIGKCFYANGVNTLQIQNIIPNFYNISGYSLCTWFYIESNNTSHSGSAIISAGDWNHEVLNLALSDWVSDHYTRLRISGTNWSRTYSYNFFKDKWYHVVVCSDQNKTYAYVNGLLIGDTADSFLPSDISGNNIDIGGATYYAGMQFFGRINDVRIYDHCLSSLEIKQISQGLILHYKFEIGTSELKTSIPSTNVYSYPTFNTSTGSGGWSHWGASGHSGHYGQNTDKNYIFNKDNSYSHWVSNDESATKNYLLYQSPAFEGGHRSLQCIIKEENGKPITQDICYPDWNARNGGTPTGLWTSIIPLNDNFYLCKCQNIQQDGSNNLVGIYVKIGYKVYFSECYLENDVQKCSSCFNSIEKFQDSSGYNHNGLLYKYDTNGNFNFIKDTPRYDTCVYIDSINNTTNTASGTVYIYGDCKLTNPTQMTIAFWCKPIAGYGGGTTQGQFCTTNIAFGSNAGSDYQASAMNHRDGAVDTNDSASSTQCRPTINFIANEWHHYVFTYNGKDAKSYRDGVLQDTKSFSESKTLDSFIGVIIGFSKAGGVWRSNKSYYSDFRVYCTALDQNDIKKLYNVNMSIDNFNNIHIFELNEIEENLFRSELITSLAKSGYTTRIGEIVEHNGDYAMNIAPAPFYKNISDDTGGFLQGYFLSNTSYTFDMWIDVDSVISNGNNVSGGLSIVYSDGTSDSTFVLVGGNKGYQHRKLITPANKSIDRVSVYYYTSTDVFYRLDSYICKTDDISKIIKKGLVKNSNFIQTKQKNSISKGGIFYSKNYIEK